VPFKKCRFGRISKTAFQCLVIRYDQTVYQQFNHRVGKQCVIRQYFTDTVNGLIDRQTGVTFFLQDFQLFLDTAPIRQDDRGVYGKTSPGGITQNFFHDIAHLMFLHLLPRHGRDGFPDTGIQEPKVFVYLRRGSHRRTRVTGVHLLFDGNGRGNTFDIVAFRLAHTPQELTSIGRKALHIAALPLRIQRIKCQ